MFFFWQLGIAREFRGKGHSSLLINKIFSAAKRCGCKRIQATIEPDNKASHATLSGYCIRHGMKMEKAGEMECIGSVNGKKETEYVYEIRL